MKGDAMDRDVLERLMLDRALGALGGDVEVLLEAYLRERPVERMEGAVLSGVVSDVRGVMKTTAPAERLPSFAGVRAVRWWDGVRGAAKLAACVVRGGALCAAGVSATGS